jgi:acyl-coenzyme A synthetase/AMP-(fatty) acid ligase
MSQSGFPGTSLGQIWAAARSGSRFCVSPDGTDTVAAAAVFDQVERAAARLKSLGVAPGEVVLHRGPQSLETLVLFWATQALGGVFAPVDPGWPAYLLARAAGHLRPRVVAAPAADLAGLTELFPVAAPISLDEGFHAWIAHAESHTTFADSRPGRPAAYLFTSGSTGVPKAVVLSDAALAHSGLLAVETFGWRPGERLVNLAEPHAMSGLRNACIAAVAGQIQWVVVPPQARPDLFSLADHLTRAGCDRLVCGPLLIRSLALMADKLAPNTLADLKAAYCTGATLNIGDVERFHRRFGAPVINYYGLTETSGLCLSQRLEGWRAQDATLGFVVGGELRLTGGQDDEGELEVRSPQVMSGYLDDPITTAARFHDGWVRTGDRARRLPDGRFMLIGRSDAFLKVATTDRVHPEEIESVLEEHESVAEAGVFGLADTGGREHIAAVVALRDGSTAHDLADALCAFVADRLGEARRPSRIRVTTALPRLASGKLQRSRLAELFDDAL